MDKLTEAITMAGFFHDFGKFAERANAVEPGDKHEVQQEYRYAHAHHTELALLQLFDESRIARQIGPSKECSVLNMAARHHKPRRDNPYEIIISEADRIASGHERIKADTMASEFDTGGRERKSKVPMLSILGRIKLDMLAETEDAKDWRYKITTPEKVVSQVDIGEVFPVSAQEYPAEQVQQDYKSHWFAFKRAIRLDKNQGLDPFDNFRTIFELSKAFMWCLPASTRKEDMPDVSLFDHLKTTSALAACLYEYHKDEKGGLTEEKIRNRKEKKYLLYCGDISGIQKFIYQISSKGAYKLLKGRSFYIQLLAEILAHHTVSSCGLMFPNILYASGGKFYLLLPNTETVKSTLDRLSEEINKELFRLFSGELYVRTGWKALTGDDFTRNSGKDLYVTWEELTRELIYNDRKRYARLATQNYHELFGIKDYLPNSCSVCHRSIKDHTHKKCSICKEMELIGQHLGTAKYIALGKDKYDINEKYSFKFLGNYAWIIDKKPTIGSPDDLTVYHLENLEIEKIPLENLSKKVNGAIFLAGSTHRFDKSFDKIAEMADGIKRLGILRMDVDDLGKIFCEGLLNYKYGNKKDTSIFYSIGRITTLSWQLSLFFSGIVPAMIRLKPEWDERITVVYSGGDDLFLLGAWNEIPLVAHEIRENFRKFACFNDSFGLSGGMVITGGSFPIYKSAEMAGEAESRAKKNLTMFKTGARKKDSFVFLDTPMHWKEFHVLISQYRNLLTILTEKENYPLLNRLRHIYASCKTCASSKEYMNLKEIEDLILAQRWQWLMVYSLARFSKNRPELENEVKDLQKFIASHVAGTNRLGIELLGVLARWCELRLRKNK